MSSKNEKNCPIAGGCACGDAHAHDHEHNHEHNEQAHDHGGDGCGCGHDHGAEKTKKDKLLLAISIVLLIISLVIDMPSIAYGLQLAATLIAGYGLFLQGIKGMLKLSLNEMTLMTIAVVAAFIIGEGFEGTMVTILFKIGEYFEDKAVTTSKNAVDALVNIIPETASKVMANGIVEEVSAKEIKVGDRILIKVGERIPLDARILEGETDVDTAAITGESVPVHYGEEDVVLSGMINLSGVITCEVQKDYYNSTANKIAQMVKDASKEKGETERFITKFSKIYTPVVVVMAIIIALIPQLRGGSLIFLVASCPCALVISVPLTFYSTIGRVSKNGVLIKGSRYVELLANAQQIVFDKTGTLTTGKLQVKEYAAVAGVDKEEMLRLAAMCESVSSHPIAKAVAAMAVVQPPETAKEIAGMGVVAQIDGKTYYCGSYKLMEQEGITLENLPKANIYLAEEGRVLGYIKIGDAVRTEAQGALQRLKKSGIAYMALLTGDRKEQGELVQKQLGLSEAFCDLLPQEKVAKLIEMKKNGITVFVGDGINDGPVLAGADVGIAMGMGSDLATQSADVVLMSNHLEGIPDAIAICKKGMTIAKMNIVVIIGVKVLVLVLGVMQIAPMWLAVFADVGLTMLAVLNAMRVIRFRLKK